MCRKHDPLLSLPSQPELNLSASKLDVPGMSWFQDFRISVVGGNEFWK